MRVVMTGGGTGGHVYPALAIAEALRDQSGDIDIQFIGTASGIESKVVPSFGETLHIIEAGSLVGKSMIGRVQGALRAARGVIQSLNKLRELRPDVIVGTGGFVMAPVLLAARILRIPFVIQEQNSYPGLTTRTFAGSARRVCIAFSQAEQYLANAATVVTGNPLRKQITESVNTNQSRACQQPPRILITGGSLGARSLNNAVAAGLSELCKFSSVTWQYGRSGLPDTLSQELLREYTESGRVRLAPFFDDLPSCYRATDMVVCRAGAMTLSEISLFGLPALLVPFPHAANDHQTVNANLFLEIGAASVLRDDQLTGETLVQGCKSILFDQNKYESMSTATRTFARPKAASEIAAIVLSSARQ